MCGNVITLILHLKLQWLFIGMCDLVVCESLLSSVGVVGSGVGDDGSYSFQDALTQDISEKNVP